MCGLIATVVDNRVPLQILQHPREAHHAKGTATLLRLGLRHVQLECGLAFTPRPGALLYPGPCEPLTAPPPQLILLDGTWRQSRVLLRANPWLLALPRVGIAAHTGGYAIRRAHRPGQLSSLEAAAWALGALEGDAERYLPLLQGFEAFVTRERQRAAAAAEPAR